MNNSVLAENNENQKVLNTINGFISKSIFQTRNSFDLITPQMHYEGESQETFH